MKLVFAFGHFSPPSICDSVLIQSLGEYRAHDTKVMLLTDDQFDRMNLMGILEKQEAIAGLLPRDVELRMDVDWVPNFLENESSDYESITVLYDAMLPKSALRVMKKSSKVPIEFVQINVGDADEAYNQLRYALYGGDFELFCKYYGGNTNTRVEYFNNMKDRTKCLN